MGIKRGELQSGEFWGLDALGTVMSMPWGGGQAQRFWACPKRLGVGGYPGGSVHVLSPHCPLPHRPVQELPPLDRTPRVHLQCSGRLPGLCLVPQKLFLTLPLEFQTHPSTG